MCFSEIYRSLKRNEHAMCSKYDIIGVISHFPQRILVAIRTEINQFPSFSQASNDTNKSKKGLKCV